jgi:hypothetical protein
MRKSEISLMTPMLEEPPSRPEAHDQYEGSFEPQLRAHHSFLLLC